MLVRFCAGRNGSSIPLYVSEISTSRDESERLSKFENSAKFLGRVFGFGKLLLIEKDAVD